jgi:hypothetical protein
MRRIVAAMLAVALAACGSQPEPADGETASAERPSQSAPAGAAPSMAQPDLAACPPRDPVDEGLRQRSQPIPVPAALREVMRSDLDDFALSTLDGGTVCVEASWMESIRDPELSPDGRFASFGWDGYEAYGHIVVDRVGKGVVIDTGMPPVPSPSGNLLAAMDLGEAGFGALNAFAVWQVTPSGLRQVAKQENVPPVTDWRIDGWAGEACIDVSARTWDDLAQEEAGREPAREHLRARQASDWRLEPGRCAAA